MPMTRATMLFKNLTRNRRRTILTLVAVALPMFVFTVARSMVDKIQDMFRRSDENLRVAVHQKLTFTAPMPPRLRADIEASAPPGYVEAICRTTWFGGRVPDSTARFGSMGVDRDTFHLVYPEFEASPQAIEAFQRERRAALISKPLANELNWEIGDTVALTGSLYPFLNIEFQIVGLLPGNPSSWLYFGRDYYHELYEQSVGEPLGVNNFWVRCTSPAAREWAMQNIDKQFANSDHETRTELESTFFAAFLRSGGDWVGLVWTVGRLIVLVAMSVAFNTMNMSFRERIKEFAVLRAVGFSSGHVVRLVLAEGLFLGLVGGLLAVGPVYVLTLSTELVIPGIPGAVRIAESTVALALGVAVICGFVAALAPAILAIRLRVAPALRKVA